MTKIIRGNTEQGFDSRATSLKSLNDLRAPLWEAILSELQGNDLKQPFLSRAATFGKQMEVAFGEFRGGKLSRAKAMELYQRELSELRRDFEHKSIDALWKHAQLQPSIPEVLSAWYGKTARDLRVRVITDKYLGWCLEPQLGSETDTGTLQQGLGGDPAPPPFGMCALPPFSLKDDRTSSQAISAGNLAIASPGSGSVFVTVMGDLAGGATAHSLVGADFDIPAGFTNISVTASVDWNYSGWSFAVGGAAGTGADIWLWIENPAGQIAVEGSSGLFSLLSPVIWGNSASGDGNSVIQASQPTPDASARTIRVFAGVSAHAEAFATVTAGCDSIVSAMISKICVTAV